MLGWASRVSRSAGALYPELTVIYIVFSGSHLDPLNVIIANVYVDEYVMIFVPASHYNRKVFPRGLKVWCSVLVLADSVCFCRPSKN